MYFPTESRRARLWLRDLAEMLTIRFETDARVSVAAGHAERGVGRGVVADHELEVLPGLAECGTDRFPDPRGGVVRRHANRDERARSASQDASPLRPASGLAPEVVSP